MKIKFGDLKKIILEMNEISGPLRASRSGGRQQHKIGKIEDENRELSSSEAEMLFPGSTNAWAEIVPSLFPDYPFDDPYSIKKHSTFFKIGPRLAVAFEEQPQVELATWSPERDDWIENDYSSSDMAAE